jgi:hypothetical protein
MTCQTARTFAKELGMRIVLDAVMNSQPELSAALEAENDPVILVGNIDQPRLKSLAGSNPPVKLIHAKDGWSNGDRLLPLRFAFWC